MSYSKNSFLELCCLLAGALALAFAQGHFPNGYLAVVGMTLWVRYFRLAKPWLAVPMLAGTNVLVWEWAYAGMVPMPNFARLGMFAAISLIFSLLFLADRWASMRSHSMWTTLLLPSGWVTFDLLSARLSPGGTWASIAYTFANEATLSQMAAIAGWTCITFFIVWIASATNWIFDRWAMDQAASKRGLAVLASIALLAFGYGTFRNATNKDGSFVRVACIVAPNTFNNEYLNDVWAYTRGIKVKQESAERAIERIRQSKDEHFSMVEKALAFDPEFIVWPEANAILTLAEEESWIQTAKAIASTHKVNIGMGMVVFRPGTGLGTLNKFVLVDSAGDLAMDTLKATRVPGSLNAKGDGVLPVVETAAGKLSAAICFDMDFPQIIAQAGKEKTDLFFAPSNDWLEVREIHAQMAKIRSIEQGFAMVRPTKDGTTLVTDSTGRTVGSMLAEDNATGMMVADVRAKRRETLYSVIGDAFGYLNGITFFAILVFLRSSRSGN